MNLGYDPRERADVEIIDYPGFYLSAKPREVRVNHLDMGRVEHVEISNTPDGTPLVLLTIQARTITHTVVPPENEERDPQATTEEPP